jgi:hypothetical protein
MEQLTLGWRKSRYSGNGGANCVEISNAPSLVLVRDTVNRDGGTLAFNVNTWRRFIRQIKDHDQAP